jgi:uncharacterized Zn finger protein (UPF0148 family)
MSEPEIARRCPHCGVSLRQSAIYCPQCGEHLAEQKAEHIADPAATEVSQAAPTQALHQTQPTPQTKTTQVFNPTAHTSEKAGVAGNVRERVEKIKHVSSVMIDQAAYDPSLRFLLVAAVLFVLFLILVILSKVIG